MAPYNKVQESFEITQTEIKTKKNDKSTYPKDLY